MRILISIILGLFLVVAMAAKSTDFTIKSSAFTDQGIFPPLYSCDGKNIPPDLSWTNPPPKTQAYALILYSPDAPMGAFYSWVVYNIPGTIQSLPEGEDLPEGALVGANTIGDSIYRGPCPPDELKHHYIFILYALDASLYLGEGADIEEVLSNIKKHTIKKTQLTGTFSH